MGITIHYELSFRGQRARAEALIRVLQSKCMDLPFDSVSEVSAVTRGAPESSGSQLLDSIRMFVHRSDDSFHVVAEEAIGFRGVVGDGCEPLQMMLCRWPRFILRGGRRVSTGLTGWSYRRYCKTQFAGAVGPEHLVRCHATVLSALDAAGQLGLLVAMEDEGKFSPLRDGVRLKEEYRKWEMLAAALREGFGARPTS